MLAAQSYNLPDDSLDFTTPIKKARCGLKPIFWFLNWIFSHSNLNSKVKPVLKVAQAALIKDLFQPLAWLALQFEITADHRRDIKETFTSQKQDDLGLTPSVTQACLCCFMSLNKGNKGKTIEEAQEAHIHAWKSPGVCWGKAVLFGFCVFTHRYRWGFGFVRLSKQIHPVSLSQLTCYCSQF